MAKKLHPLFAALVAELESPKTWTAEERANWLKMAAMAFDMVFGANEVGFTRTEPYAPQGGGFAPPTGGTAPANGNGHRMPAGANLRSPLAPDQTYFIDMSGRAYGPSGRIDPGDIVGTDIIWDMRPGEQGLDSVEWADGSRGMPQQPLTVYKG